MTPNRQGRIAALLAGAALVGMPLSYVWVLSPGEDPPWMTPLIVIGEWGGLAAAIVAIWLGRRAVTAGATGRGARWAPRIAIAAIVLYMALLLVVAAAYR